MKLSIIIPVYQVEKYIRPCLESIFQQGIDEEDYEVIIINDGTKDRSMEIIADLIGQHSNVTVVNQENQGISVARNNGMALAKGEYILMPDSDDLLIEGSLKPLLEKALETKADLVVADFTRMTDEEIEHGVTLPTQKAFKAVEKNGHQLYMDDLQPHCFYVWRTLYRRQFIADNQLSFVPGIYFEDIAFTHEAYLKARKCVRAYWLLYIYRRGHDSVSHFESFTSKKGYDFCVAIAKSWELRHMGGLTTDIAERHKRLVYYSYSNLLYRVLFRIDTTAQKVQILEYLHQLAPDMEFTYSIKQRLGNCLYKLSPSLYVILQKRLWK